MAGATRDRRLVKELGKVSLTALRQHIMDWTDDVLPRRFTKMACPLASH